MPISAERNEGKLSFKSSSGGLATGLGCVFPKEGNIWIGWPGGVTPEIEERKFVVQSLEPENMSPVFLEQKEIDDFYEGFSNSVLWPLFHCFPQYATFNKRFWDAYVNVNKKFSVEVIQKAEVNDIIWIHDYHLLLLPQFVKESLSQATVAFFQHIPFPPYEIFRMLPWRKELLTAMCGADLLGFHTEDDVYHFTNSVTRILGYSFEDDHIHNGSHYTKVASFPMGIDYHKYEKLAHASKTQKIAAKYKSILKNQKLLLSIDRLDYSKGILQRLRAFDFFLKENPKQREKISMIMVVVPSRELVKEYRELKEEIDTLVGRINSNFSSFNWVPIHYFYRSFPIEELSAFYRVADIALVTPLRDGMNLVCKEYIASKGNRKGVLILSEMAGASKELQEAILVNPNNIQEIARAIETAISMDEGEQLQHLSRMQEQLRNNDVFSWVRSFMSGLNGIKSEPARSNPESLKLIAQYFKSWYEVFFSVKKLPSKDIKAGPKSFSLMED